MAKTTITTTAARWLREEAMPLWSQRGWDADRGGFHERLSARAEPLTEPRRLTVQARQVYSFRAAADLGALDARRARELVEDGARFMDERYSLPSGAFAHSLGTDGKPADPTPDLYAQAFGIFGLAHAYALTRDQRWKRRAHGVRSYLDTQRRVPAGGFSELKSGPEGGNDGRVLGSS